MGVLEGRVVDERGAPVPDVWIALDGRTTRSGADGGFVLELSEPGATGILWAAAAHRAATRLERIGASNLDPSAFPEPLELVVGGDALAIRGRVLDAAGEPVAGARVRLVDPTDFGAVPFEDRSDLLLGSHVEALLRGARYSYAEHRTEADGRFALEGLLDRAYDVKVVDPASLLPAHFQLRPGPDERDLRLSEAPSLRRVAGRVIHPDGSPAIGVEVELQAQRDHEPGWPEWIEGERVATSEDGSFEFPRASAAATRVTVVAANAPAAQLQTGDVLDLELILARRCHVQVVLDDPAEATHLMLLDVDGQPVQALVQQGNIMWGQSRIELVEGRSQAVRVDEGAVELVLYRGDEELRRVPLTLVPGELTTVRP